MLTLAEFSQLLCAAQGIIHPRGYRPAPSAGALYLPEVYVVAGNVTGLQAGIYKYRPQGHELEKVAGGDVRPELCAAALDQEFVEDGAAVLVFVASMNGRPGSTVSGAYGMCTWKWGMRPRMFICRLFRWGWGLWLWEEIRVRHG